MSKLFANVLQIGGRFNAANLLLCSRCGFLALNFNRSTVIFYFFCAVGKIIITENQYFRNKNYK
jgi:hypothetical protein